MKQNWFDVEDDIFYMVLWERLKKIKMIFHKIEHIYDEQFLSTQTLLGYDVLKSSSDEGT